ncbi:phosphatidylserine decarboxylase [Syntrophorhabdus aromaticivorans]|jgi:phosphatidylserine decarboxylase|uniref:Phosphatidylserine decarboxylase n=1 Tax=Syntrophorhabdus aromaticivorans TaxID=328301 RepID=A0A971RZY4_9BACT|nr:phosphatidylserine decarboxylase [Syntrophorhabdus aromaticivorans]NLW34775.1 phosphatidylserine decarboxylase [Syntrophorhabdus aromaticivorans]
MVQHQYIERGTRNICNEQLYWDRIINFLYSKVRESSPALFRLLTGPRLSEILSFFVYEPLLGQKLSGTKSFLKRCGINLQECLEAADYYDTPRKIFERQIRYWESRPMPDDPQTVVSPADARALVGSFSKTKTIFIKEKFFEFRQLLGYDRTRWLSTFADGDFAIFRLTPDKYHYNHTPVAGKIVDFYEIPGAYHSCNPGAVVTVVTPYSINKRVVTIFDTDVPGGSHVGFVGMIEVVALMIGDIVQRYSEKEYNDHCEITPGMHVKRGAPKSMYRPGSSTDILVFQKDRVCFAEDILQNRCHKSAQSRFTLGFGVALVETDVKVRSPIAVRVG